MKPREVTAWISLLATILAGGVWLGRLDQKVAELERLQTYEHGSYRLPNDIGDVK